MGVKGKHPNVDPKSRAVEMLNTVYDALPEKDMPREAFIKESLDAIKQSKNRKNSPIIQP